MSRTREPQTSVGVYRDVHEADDRETPALLAAIRRGDGDALDRVARAHAPRLFRFAMRLTGRRDEAEDLVQETLLQALPALRRFEGRARLSTYLIRALSNRWKNRLRSKKRSRLVEWFRVGRTRTKRHEDQPAEIAAVDPSPDPLARLEKRDEAERVRRAVSRLEPTRRLTLLLREVEEMSYEEIAHVTRVPVGTVRSRLARARGDLRAILGDGS
jgi:RNA polymerase sigma-70 factor (ECF subfamily)